LQGTSARALVVLSLLVIQAALLGFSATRHSPTCLEPAFLAAGLSHWQFDRFELYRVNPPLVRMVAALPILAAGCETDWSRFHDGPGSRAEFPVGDDFVKANGPRVARLLCYARWACIPFSLIGAFFAYRWAKELYGDSAGFAALALFVFEPNLLAHGELITPDGACTAFGLLAGYTFWRWLKRPTWGRATLSGAALGLAELSKMSWITLFSLWPLLWWAWRRLSPLQTDDRKEDLADRSTHASCLEGEADETRQPPLLQLSAILVLALYLVNLAYGFDGSLTQLKEHRFASRLMTGPESSGRPGNRFRNSVFGKLPVPLPRQYVLGFDSQKRDLEDYGKPSYLRGEWRDGGWWYYYLYGLLVKVPCGTWLLLAVVGVRRLCSPGRAASLRDELVLVAPAIVLLAVVSSQTEFNHHLRYVYPSLGLMLIFAAQAVARSPAALSSEREPDRDAAPRGRGDRLSLFVELGSASLVAYSVASALLVYPHHLSYFNDFVGGPRFGHNHLLGSNLDWGQDTCQLIDWLAWNGQSRPLFVISEQQYDAAPLGLTAASFSRGSFDSALSSGSSPLILVSKNLVKITPEFLKWGDNMRWREWYEFQSEFKDRLVAVPLPFNAYEAYTIRF